MNHRDDDKLKGGEIVIGGGWKSKLDNFWFYHKWHLLLGAFIALILFVCLMQGKENKKDDVTLMFAGPYKLTSTEIASLRMAFIDVMPEDFNHDGDKYTELVMMQLYSDEQEAAIKANPENPPYAGYIDQYYNDEQVTSFDNLVMAGEYAVCVLDPWLYERIKSAGGFRTLSDVLGYTPEGAVDEYGVRLIDTDFAKVNPVCALFPEDSVICLRTTSVMGSIINKNKTNQDYANSEAMFRAILNFRVSGAETAIDQTT